jgi:hypothetical protein
MTIFDRLWDIMIDCIALLWALLWAFVSLLAFKLVFRRYLQAVPDLWYELTRDVESLFTRRFRWP